ncbi:MAG TPA: hypothetical protein VGF45_01415, partial [Polyangia bacterium]
WLGWFALSGCRLNPLSPASVDPGPPDMGSGNGRLPVGTASERTGPAVDASPSADSLMTPIPLDSSDETSAVDTLVAEVRDAPVDLPVADGAGAARLPSESADAGVKQPQGAPPTWPEHWYEHREVLRLAAASDHAFIYYDGNVTSSDAAWILPFASNVWRYTKQTYGAFGNEPRLFWIQHQGRLLGAHMGGYLEPSHDFRNTVDVGTASSAAGPMTRMLALREIGRIVENFNNGVRGSPASFVWGYAKWAELFEYDYYVSNGMAAEAAATCDRLSAAVDSFPREGTHWFRDWFYPLWRDRGRTQLMVRFFRSLAQHYPKTPDVSGRGMTYARAMNWGEYVHFMSGAAGTNLKTLATAVFGWSAERELQIQQARTQFGAVTYPY